MIHVLFGSFCKKSAKGAIPLPQVRRTCFCRWRCLSGSWIAGRAWSVCPSPAAPCSPCLGTSSTRRSVVAPLGSDTGPFLVRQGSRIGFRKLGEDWASRWRGRGGLRPCRSLRLGKRLGKPGKQTQTAWLPFLVVSSARQQTGHRIPRSQKRTQPEVMTDLDLRGGGHVDFAYNFFPWLTDLPLSATWRLKKAALVAHWWHAPFLPLSEPLSARRAKNLTYLLNCCLVMFGGLGTLVLVEGTWETNPASPPSPNPSHQIEGS